MTNRRGSEFVRLVNAAGADYPGSFGSPLRLTPRGINDRCPLEQMQGGLPLIGQIQSFFVEGPPIPKAERPVGHLAIGSGEICDGERLAGIVEPSQP